MNKEEFIKELVKLTNLSEEKCTSINSILEDTFLIGKNNKEKLLSKFEEKLGMTKEEAENIYEKAMSILTNSLKDKLKHPFGGKEN